MALGELDILDKEEIYLLKALMHLKLVTEGQANEFLEYRRRRQEHSKKYLGQVLIELGLITQADIDQYVKENHAGHVAFINQLTSEGYLTHDQHELLFRKEKETGHDLISLINELNIMTRDSYSRIFNKRTSVLRLGEWLLVKHKVTKERMDEAVNIQKIVSIEDYLVHGNMVKRDIIDKVKEKLFGMAN